MQNTSKFALLAVALLGTSALALPIAREAEYVEAREVNNDLYSREFCEKFLEARADPTLDARELEVLELENPHHMEACGIASEISEIVCPTE